jgi:catechol 2,3-dioxygenase-like lactoylglutathione lyase family enzyme
MKVEAIDHVNIRTPDVVGTSRFFASVLDMTVAEAPGMNDVTKAAWIHDAEGRAVIHVAGPEVIYGFEADATPQAPGSGRVHHVALRCAGYEALLNRLQTQGRRYHTNQVPQVKLRQVFIEEPNSILLELNFFGD